MPALLDDVIVPEAKTVAEALKGKHSLLDLSNTDLEDVSAGTGKPDACHYFSSKVDSFEPSQLQMSPDLPFFGA